MPVRGPMLLHRMALVSFRLFCKNLGNLQEFFGQMVYRPPWPKIARTPMLILLANALKMPLKNDFKKKLKTISFVKEYHRVQIKRAANIFLLG